MSSRLLALLAALSLAPGALAGTAAPDPSPGRHEVRIRIEPADSRIEVRDRYTAPHESRLHFTLREELELSALSCGETNLLPRLKDDRRTERPGARQLRVPRSCRTESGEMVLDFEISGVLADEPKAEPSLHFVTGERSTGIVSEDGAFLTGGTGFVPDFGELALFDLVADVPAGWSVASQGAIVEPEETPEEGRALFAYEAELPSDGLALSAGPYHVSRREHGDRLYRTFFFEEHEERAETFLTAAIGYVDRFESMFGPYPYSKFDIVENFFTTGYGFPGYTLLGSRVVAMGERALRPGYVDHEVAHCWWGNGVFLSPEGGNWCEGLTTYVANYMSAERSGDEAAAAHRRKVAQRYALDVSAETDFAPAAFEWKKDDAGSAIGYGKVSLVFHQLRRRLGDESFWAGLRELAARRVGQRASWSDIRGTFEEVSGEELGAFFEQWVERAGLPRLVLDGVVQDGGVLRGRILQEGESYELRPELRVTLADGTTRSERLEVSGEASSFRIETGAPALRVEIDPDWHLPRSLSADELPHSLARTLAAKRLGHELIVAYPIAPAEATPALAKRVAAYKRLAEQAAEQHGGLALPALAVAEAEWSSSSLLLLGGPDENPLAGRMLEPMIAAGFDPKGAGFRAGSRRWLGEGDSLLLSLPHPDRAGASVTTWVPNGQAAMDSSRYVFFYGWDSWVALRDGRAMERGTTWPESSPWSVTLGKPSVPDSTVERLKASVAALTAPELEGRDAATDASRRTAERVGAAMEAAGLQPWDPRGFQQVIVWFLRDMDRQPVLFRERRDRTSNAFACAPAPYWLPVPPNLMSIGDNVELSDKPVTEPILVPFPEGLVHAGTVDEPKFEGLDLRSAAALLVDDTALPPRETPRARAAYERERTARYMELLREVRLREGETLIVARPQDEPPFFPALSTYGSLDVERDPRLAEARERGGDRDLDRLVSTLHAEMPQPDVPVRLAFAGRDLLDGLRAEQPLRPGARWWQGLYLDLRMRIETHRVFDRNLIGLTVGMRRLSEGLVLVGSHHDGRGMELDGRPRPGTLDSATGTAVLLELARRFGEDPPPLTVAFASFGAHEWGLVGSRSLASAWPAHWPVRAMVNLDRLGETGAGYELVQEPGGSGLDVLLGESLESRGLPVTTATSDEALDHRPWALTGAPAITLRQPEGASEDVDYEELASLVDALEAALRELAGGGDS